MNPEIKSPFREKMVVEVDTLTKLAERIKERDDYGKMQDKLADEMMGMIKERTLHLKNAEALIEKMAEALKEYAYSQAKRTKYDGPSYDSVRIWDNVSSALKAYEDFKKKDEK